MESESSAPDARSRSMLRFLISAAGELCGLSLVGGQSIGEGYCFSKSDGTALSEGDVGRLRDSFASLHGSGGSVGACTMSSGGEGVL